MSRAKGSIRTRRRKKFTKQAKGYWGARKNVYKVAKEAVHRGMAYATRDRKQRKRQFRRLWIIRINAGLKDYDLSYSRFMHGLKEANVEIDRKMLADLAFAEPESFQKLVELVKNQATEAALTT